MTDPIPADLLAPAPFTDEALDLILEWQADPERDQPPEDAEPSPVERWEVTDLNSAAWCMGRLGGAEADLRSVAEQAEEWITNIKAWQEQASRAAERRASFFRGHLEAYGRARRDADPECKSVALPNGTISTRGHKAQVVVTDPDGLAKWALDAGHYEWLSIKPLVSKVREATAIVTDPLDEDASVAVTPDGELVPGVEIESEGFSVTVKPKA